MKVKVTELRGEIVPDLAIENAHTGDLVETDQGQENETIEIGVVTEIVKGNENGKKKGTTLKCTGIDLEVEIEIVNVNTGNEAEKIVLQELQDLGQLNHLSIQ